jgi:hypothetical protein
MVDIPRSNWLNLVFSFLITCVSFLIGSHTLLFSRCIGHCNGLEGLVTIVWILPIWIIFGIICYIDTRNKNIWFALYYFSVGIICFFVPSTLLPIREFVNSSNLIYIPEILAFLFGFSVFIYPLFLVWNQKSIGKFISVISVLIAFVSTIGFSSIYVLTKPILKPQYQIIEKEKAQKSKQSFDSLCLNAKQKLNSFKPTNFYEKTKKYKFVIELTELPECNYGINLASYKNQEKVLDIKFITLALVKQESKFPTEIYNAQSFLYKENDFIENS